MTVRRRPRRLIEPLDVPNQFTPEPEPLVHGPRPDVCRKNMEGQAGRAQRADRSFGFLNQALTDPLALGIGPNHQDFQMGAGLVTDQLLPQLGQRDPDDRLGGIDGHQHHTLGSPAATPPPEQLGVTLPEIFRASFGWNREVGQARKQRQHRLDIGGCSGPDYRRRWRQAGLRALPARRDVAEAIVRGETLAADQSGLACEHEG